MYNYNGMMAGIIIISIYAGLWATNLGLHLRIGERVFNWRVAISVLLGILLGYGVTGPLFDKSMEAGALGMGASVAVMYIVCFSGIITALINHLPENFRVFCRRAITVLRFMLIGGVITVVVFALIKLVGIQ